MVGFIVLEVFHFITWPWKELEIAVAWPPCAVRPKKRTVPGKGDAVRRLSPGGT